MSRAVLSIGSNQGDPEANLRLAVRSFRTWLVAASPVYRTPPWGPVPQDDYLNAILIVFDPEAEPADWLLRAQGAEQLAARQRLVRWGPRTLDVDVVDVDGIESHNARLTLPHPRAAERAFVMVPWLAVDPDAVLGGVALGSLIAGLPAEDVHAIQLQPGITL